ncbi:MAG: FKBP-type peptidyl-prolyl cis-trans isomerase [Helicobacteraceae bacterium]|jgi:FKBP-type peptidyl-prolyl cis-trans isomerase FklB|nr:FKBP-type peptidyl-prolyl cis-trans isomerase [Helicobacteraceae bacterium]
MKKIYLSTLAIALVGMTMAGCNEDKAAKAKTDEVSAFTTQEQKVGYAIGAQIGAQLAMTKDDIDSKALISGLTDAMDGAALKLTDQQMQEAKMAFQKSVQEKAQKEMMKLAETNKAEGAKFLAENKTKEGVVTLPSGLQYKIVQAGTGATPTATDTVVTHYTGTLLNGKVFDSSVQRGEPATFPVNGVIAGWTEALQHMKVGGKWQLFIPAELAYGERGAGKMIAPDSTLIFDIELLEIKK